MVVKSGDPEMAREINRALILNVFRNNETTSRTEIARLLHLSKVTVSNIISDLIEDGYVLEVGEGISLKKGGRRPILLELNTQEKFVIGVDLGTTNTVCAVGKINGDILKEIRIHTSKNHAVQEIVDQVTHLVNETIDKSGVSREKIVGLAIAVAGQVEKNVGRIIFSPHFNWHDVYISKLLEDRIGFKTIADNCTRVLALGEMWFGEGRNVRNLLFIGVGFGVGSALVIDKKIYNHHSEFGHIKITEKRIQCPCGKYGCLEVVASGSTIEREANTLMHHQDGEWITAKVVAEMALAGDPIALNIFNEVGRYLGRGISILANSLNPDKIVIGGGISLAGALLMDPILREFKKDVIDVVREKTQVCRSLLGMEAGVRGAVAMALNDCIFNYEIVNRQIRSNHINV
jgi:glucokinase-like ROK family protein